MVSTNFSFSLFRYNILVVFKVIFLIVLFFFKVEYLILVSVYLIFLFKMCLEKGDDVWLDWRESREDLLE